MNPQRLRDLIGKRIESIMTSHGNPEGPRERVFCARLDELGIRVSVQIQAKIEDGLAFLAPLPFHGRV